MRTFAVILSALLLQSLTLPYLIRKLKLADPDDSVSDQDVYNDIRKQLTRYGLNYLNSNYTEQLGKQSTLQQITRKMGGQRSANDGLVMLEELKSAYR